MVNRVRVRFYEDNGGDGSTLQVRMWGHGELGQQQWGLFCASILSETREPVDVLLLRYRGDCTIVLAVPGKWGILYQLTVTPTGKRLQETMDFGCCLWFYELQLPQIFLPSSDVRKVCSCRGCKTQAFLLAMLFSTKAVGIPYDFISLFARTILSYCRVIEIVDKKAVIMWWAWYAGTALTLLHLDCKREGNSLGLGYLSF